jgi:hypothetical protein
MQAQPTPTTAGILRPNSPGAVESPGPPQVDYRIHEWVVSLFGGSSVLARHPWCCAHWARHRHVVPVLVQVLLAPHARRTIPKRHEPEIHRVGPKFASWPSSLTENTY